MTDPAEFQSISILGVRVHDVTYEEALAAIEGWVGDGVTHQVVTINPEFIMTARQDEEFRGILNEASLAVPDGVGISLASRILRHPFRQRVTGVDTVERLAELSARKGYRLFFLGAAPGVADEAARCLRARHRGLMIAGTYAGSPNEGEEPHIAERVRGAKADFLLVAFGAPRQDKWIYRNRGNLGVAMAMGVGGTFDFISGRVARAPEWMQRLGLEWLHRLYREPWRWRRMLALPRFVGAVLIEGVVSRFRRDQ